LGDGGVSLIELGLKLLDFMEMSLDDVGLLF
jgi:hypothetical protein